MLRLRCLIAAAVILASQAAQAQPATLTLACKGTTIDNSDQSKQPISMGIIVNFTDRTVQGFGSPNGVFDRPLELGYTDDTTIRFGGKDEGAVRSTIIGFIDRVTGDVQANWLFIDKTGKLEPHMTYALQCKPAQRMF
jgi:hypothetical protein